MGKVPIYLSLTACAVALLPSAGEAASDADVAALRVEIASLKSEYADRVGALEARINELEAANTAAVAAAAEAPPPAPSSPAKSASAFNPSISVFLTGNYTDLSQDPSSYYIAGFIPSGDEGPGDRNFNLGESEVTLAAK